MGKIHPHVDYAQIAGNAARCLKMHHEERAVWATERVGEH